MDVTPTPYEALNDAVMRAGSQSEFARICGVSQPSVWKWLNSSKRLPAEYVLPVETATGVSRHDLRPDIYPRDLRPRYPAPTGRGDDFYPRTLDGSAAAVACDRPRKFQPEPAL